MFDSGLMRGRWWAEGLITGKWWAEGLITVRWWAEELITGMWWAEELISFCVSRWWAEGPTMIWQSGGELKGVSPVCSARAML